MTGWFGGDTYPLFKRCNKVICIWYPVRKQQSDENNDSIDFTTKFTGWFIRHWYMFKCLMSSIGCKLPYIYMDIFIYIYLSGYQIKIYIQTYTLYKLYLPGASICSDNTQFTGEYQHVIVPSFGTVYSGNVWFSLLKAVNYPNYPYVNNNTCSTSPFYPWQTADNSS